MNISVFPPGGGRIGLQFVVLLASIAIMIGCKSGSNTVKEPAATSIADQPLTTFSQEITSPVHEFEIVRDQQTQVQITVKNPSTQSWFRDGKHPVRLSYKWFQDGRPLPYEGERTFLPVAEMKPGQAESFQAAVLAPEKETGKLTLAITMVQEGVAWFHETGATPLRINAVVR
jgi:hypothetical protein